MHPRAIAGKSHRYLQRTGTTLIRLMTGEEEDVVLHRVWERAALGHADEP